MCVETTKGGRFKTIRKMTREDLEICLITLFFCDSIMSVWSKFSFFWSVIF